jgi:hypothetical protein
VNRPWFCSAQANSDCTLAVSASLSAVESYTSDDVVCCHGTSQPSTGVPKSVARARPLEVDVLRAGQQST